MNKGIKILTYVGIVLTIFAPLLFIQEWTGISFNDTGEIGDTIGGTTAPIIGLLSIILLIYTLLEQVNFNKKQKEISTDEQFKSTFFNLLQVQRDILGKITGSFTYLGMFVHEEHSEKKGKIEVTRLGKEFVTIKDNNEEVSGIEFFKAAKYQLKCIFKSLDYNTFHENYDLERAFEEENRLETELFHGNNIPEEIEKAQEEEIINTRMPFASAYINDKYGITKFIFEQYKQLNEEKRIGLSYACFFNKYESVGYYFRHLYRILKFIKKNEDDKIQALGTKASELEKKDIHDQFKQYAQFIQAQMSTDELFLLYYNCFTFDKALKLITHYDLLENLTIQNLIKKEHNCKPELKLKDKTNLFLDIIRK